MHRYRRVTVMWLVLTCLLGTGSGQDTGEALKRRFQDPPDAAKPRTWWHWTGGNITKEGITKDLEWMQRVGIAGMQLADVSFGGGQTIEEKVDFGSPAWLDAVHHAAAEAQRLGLELTLFSSAGWSLTGGPWVKPEQAMKKLVWSETTIEGPQSFHAKLTQPPSNNGPFQNMGRREGPDPTYYGDSAVVAYPTPAAENGTTELNPKVTTMTGSVDANALMDNDWNSSITISRPEDRDVCWLQFEFAELLTVRAISLAGARGIPVGRITASEDGAVFHTLVSLPGAQLYRQGRVRTFAFPETTARIYRIEFTGAPLGPAETMSQAPTEPADEYVLSEVHLHTGARVHRWEEKAGFSFLFEYDSVSTPAVAPELAVPGSQVINLTEKMSPDGTLQWDVPPGKWTVLRLGYSLTGAKNRPATPAGLGYEVDKLSRKHVQAYYRGFSGPLKQRLGSLYGDSLQYFLLDSWEAGMQNWTEEMLDEFQNRRGYDPTPYLPVLVGRVIESAEVSDRFLWDFRRTLADMFADNFYAAMDELLERDGLSTYSEASGVSLEIPEDTLLNKSKVDIPTGEFWVRDLHPRLMYYQDVRGAASAAHVYGKTIVATESFTGGGYESPYRLKQVGDYWFAQGLNRIIFHTSAHQPLDTKPGNTMVGTHIHRNITWAEQAKPFMTYLARNCFMLQQGLFVADLVYLLAEGAPSTMPIWGAGLQPKPPQGYDFDYINADVLLHRISVAEDGRLTLPDGMSYRVLVLPQIESMRPVVLRKIHDLVKAGATIVGPRPKRSPSLMDYPEADASVRSLAHKVWGDLDGISRTKRVFGKGTVVWGLPLQDVMQSLDIPKDVEYSRALDTELTWLHRRTDDTDIYYVTNLTDRPQTIDARFRVNGKAAELWHPDTGDIEPASYWIAKDRTTVKLALDQHETVFVVFREATTQLTHTVPGKTQTILATVAGPWDVSFPPNLGAPDHIEMSELASWTESDNDGVKYFSGTGTYTKAIQVPQSWLQAGTRLWLNLGSVKDIAEVSINGSVPEILWKPPYQIDVTDRLNPGRNQLIIKVTNQWTNRQAGDRSVPADQRVLGSGGSRRFFGRVQPLVESGLLGPVTIMSSTEDDQ